MCLSLDDAIDQEATRLSDLEVLQALTDLKASYTACTDGKRWTDLKELFESGACATFEQHPAITGNPDGHDLHLESAKGVTDYISERLGDAQTLHLVWMPRVRMLSPRRAVVRWAMHDIVRRPGSDDRSSFEGYGQYDDCYVLGADETWRISSMRLSRTHMERS